jgi:hypothetical protein
VIARQRTDDIGQRRLVGEPSIVIRTLAPKAIVIAARGETGAGSGAVRATVTGTKSGRPSCDAANCCRQRYRRLRSTPVRLATSVALAPRSINAATHASFSERDQRRRLSTDVMTSIRFMALWLSLVLATLSYAAHSRSQGGAFRTDTLETDNEEEQIHGRADYCDFA